MKKILFIVSLFFVGNGIVSAQVGDGSRASDDDRDAVMPGQIISETDSMVNAYNSEMYAVKDTVKNYTEAKDDYSKEIYIKRLQRLPNIIEMPYNDQVKEEIDRYTVRLRSRVSRMIGVSNLYMPLFERALESYKLPLELKYLPIIESGLDPNAVSRVGAAGLWQFMIDTAKKYGLEVNSLVDERRDPYKATYAAAHYLRDLYDIFGDWNLVIAAYNCGAENITKAMHRSGKTDYWEIYSYLPRETQGYVPAFIAANYVMNYYCKHNIRPENVDLPVKTDTVMVDSDIHFGQIEGVMGISVEQLRIFNPQYRCDLINGNTKLSSVCLPADKITTFIDSLTAIKEYKSEEFNKRREEIKIEKKAVRKYNKKKRRSVIIRNGQTLSQIAKENHTTVGQLQRLNGLKGTSIRAGKRLRVR